MLSRLLATTFLLFTSTAWATDFRIETKVFANEEEIPISQNTTLFQAGVVYDFLESPRRVAIFRHERGDEPGLFLLIDPERRLKTEMTTDRIDAAIDKLTTWAAEQKNPLLRFAAEPQLEETFDKESGVLTLTGSRMSYRLSTTPTGQREVWDDLSAYFNEYAKLNCLLSSAMPPLPRLEVNKALARHRIVPVEVNLSLADPEQTSLRAEHLFTWRLSKDDRAQIAMVGEQLVNFRDVSNAEFRDEMATAAK
ncbi:MAG: hypothetical protein ACR2NU_01925 [Aeoliella sp.]